MKASTHRGQGRKTRFLAVDRVNTANGAVKKKRSWMPGTRKEIKLWMKPAPGADPAPFPSCPPRSFPQNGLTMRQCDGAVSAKDSSVVF